MAESNPFEGWAILELFGHRRLAGYISEQQVGGTSFVRIDVPGEGDAPAATQLYGGSAIYCLTPTTEEIARRVAASCRPEPVQRWELPPERQLADRRQHDDVIDNDEEDDEE